MAVKIETQSTTPQGEKIMRTNRHTVGRPSAINPTEPTINGKFGHQIEPSAEELQTVEKELADLDFNGADIMGRFEHLDGLGLHLIDISNIPLQIKEHEGWGQAIFAGKIALLSLFKLSQCDLLNPSQEEKVGQTLQENKFLLPIAKSAVKNTRLRLKNNSYEDEQLRKLDQEFMDLIKASEEAVGEKINQAKVSEDKTERARSMQRFIDNQIKCADRGRLALDNLVTSNLRLSFSVARRRYHQQEGFLLNDLVSYAEDGIREAAARWDYRKQIQFSTYAVWWIRQALSRNIIDEGPLIRLPVSVSDQVRRYRKEQARLPDRTSPTNIPLPDTLVSGLKTQKVVSLNKHITAENDTELGETIPDTTADDIEDIVGRRAKKEVVGRELFSLEDRERRILELRFGLRDGRARSLEEVGRDFGVTRERIRQIEAKALAKLRQSKTLKKAFDD